MILTNFTSVGAVQDILPYLKSLSQGKLLVVLDIDNTLIMPLEFLNDIIDALKVINNDICKDLVSEWRLNRKVTLTDDSWPKFLLELQDHKNIKVIALTQMDNGQYGFIPSLEKWRYNELKALGLTFAEATMEPQDFAGGSYYGGIYFTGTSHKKNLLEEILSQDHSYNTLLIVDDKESQLKAMKTAAKRFNIVSQTLQYYCNKSYRGLSEWSKAFLQKIIDREGLEEKIKDLAKKKLLDNHKASHDLLIKSSHAILP